MKKQLRKLLSALLVLTMLLSALPMGVFAEEDHVPAVVDELTEEGTKELDAEPTIELNEEPAAEPTEEPAVQPTVAPIVDSSDDALENATAGEPKTEPEKEPAVQPTVAPIVDLTDDALETATAGEPETEPEKEPETTPAAEDEVDEGKPEETPAPAENNDDDTLSGLTDEQRKTLNALPEGFSADVVAFAMLRSTGCAHTLLKVSEVFDESYTSIDSKKHLFMKKNLSRKLFCSACGEALQTIELGDSESEESHSWYSDGNTGGSLFDFTCLDCDEKITINPPCSHGSYSLNKNRMPYCTECGAIAYPGESMTMDDLCKHTHYTVHYPNTKLTEYSRWNDASHLKTTKVAQYTDDSESSQYYPAVCNDCGADLVYLPSGKVEQLEGYDGELWGEMEYVQTASDFEVHTFANGVCKYCGEEQSEESCQHTNVKQVENTAKKTIDVTPVDDAKHQITTTRYFELRCADCDAYIGEAPADVSTQNEAHVWDDKNICTKCDYGNDCTHNNSTFHHYAKGDTHTGYQWTGNGETHYVIKYEVLVECDCCLGCMRFYLSSGTDGESRKLVSIELVAREKERYTETCHITNGWTEDRYFCMYCGYEKVICDHSSGNTVDRLDRTVEPLYSDITETTHREQYTYNRYCDDCDTYLETVLGEVLAPVAHNFGNGNTCDCGYTKTEEPCQHTETKRVENTGKRTSELKPFSETEHEVTTTKYYELVCAACDAYISDDGTDTTTEKQSHDFSNGNTCACGYTKAEESCQHTKTKRVESVGSRKTELISLNDAEHEVKTTKTFKIRCAACDAYIRDDGTETTTVNKPHDLGNGNTCACGYTKVETPEDAPYVLGFTMSVTEIEVDGTVTFTLSIANAKDGDKLAIEMRADDKFTVDKEVTVKDGKASCAHKFSNTGDRSIKFRVAGGEYCPAQTLKVLPKKTGTSAIIGVRVSPPINEARVEKKDGETFTVTVDCNLDTVCVEMYFGKEHNQDTYRSSKEYVEANGTRTFTLTYTLGGNGKRYAGDYPISVRPFSHVDHADWKNNQMGEEVKITLKVTHDNVSTVNEGGYSYSWSANGHTRMQTITTTLECKVCGNVSKSSTKIAKGSEEPHDLKENGKCSVCGYCDGGLKINDDVATVGGEDQKYIDKTKYEIKNRWEYGMIKPYYYLDPDRDVSGNASPEIYEKIILQFDVTGKHGGGNYYVPTGSSTYCNFFAADVCSAMGAFFPQSQMCTVCHKPSKASRLGEKLYALLEENGLMCDCEKSIKKDIAFSESKKEDVTANVDAWMLEYAEMYGWQKIPANDSQKVSKALEYANSGYLTIGVYWKHVFIVHPNTDNPDVMYQTQAGGGENHDNYSLSEKMSIAEINKRKGNSVRSAGNKEITYYVFKGEY